VLCPSIASHRGSIFNLQGVQRFLTGGSSTWPWYEQVVAARDPTFEGAHPIQASEPTNEGQEQDVTSSPSSSAGESKGEDVTSGPEGAGAAIEAASTSAPATEPLSNDVSP
jgi:hypothetical protein